LSRLSCTPGPRESRVYFTDRDLGKQFPALLSAAGLAVERHIDLFPPEGSDEQWLEHCGTDGRVAISHNKNIRYVPNELATVVRFKTALIIVVGHVPNADLALNFVHSMRRIEAFLNSNAPPFIAKLYRPTAAELAKSPTASGRIDLWYPRR
jgi:hypothetical protein